MFQLYNSATMEHIIYGTEQAFWSFNRGSSFYLPIDSIEIFPLAFTTTEYCMLQIILVYQQHGLIIICLKGKALYQSILAIYTIWQQDIRGLIWYKVQSECLSRKMGKTHHVASVVSCCKIRHHRSPQSSTPFPLSPITTRYKSFRFMELDQGEI